MASTYTLNNGIELIGTGEQSGTWGDTTNDNLQFIDTALDGQVTITPVATGTSGSPNTLPIVDGSSTNSEGRNRMVIITSLTDLGGSVYYQLTPNDAEKIIYIRNTLLGDQDLILFQGTYSGSNAYVVKSGSTAVVYFDGTGAGAVAANVLNTLQLEGLNVDGGTIKLDGNYPVGTGNVALGDAALDSNVSGGSNTAIGADALTANTASNNTTVGYRAGYSNTTGTGHVLVGDQAGLSNTTGNYLVALGGAAGYSNTTGERNIAIGQNTLFSNSTGSYNSALGYSALFSNTTAGSSTAVGYQAGYSMTAGDGNTFVGYHAGYANNGSGTYRNTFIGYSSGSAVSSGYKNTIIGSYNGNQGGLDIRTSSNNIVLSDGDGNPWGYFNYGGGSNLWVFKASGSNQNNAQFRNTSATNPYGPIIAFDGAAPNNTSVYALNFTDTATFRFIVWSNGNVVNTNNSYGAISDVKLKENIVDASSQWDDIKALTVRKYSMKADNLDAPNRLGVIAQEVEAAGMGGLVFESPDIDPDTKEDLGTVTKQVNYSILYMKAVKALQEAMERIETLEAKVAALEAN